MFEALESLMKSNENAADMPVLIADTEGTEEKYIFSEFTLETVTGFKGEDVEVLVIR